MFYLTKFCRICVKTSETLLDINSKDYDLVKLSDKLEFCTKMVISKEDLSTLICMSCVKKLRITYVFQSMCMKSDQILHGYLKELISENENEKFINSDLRVTITPIPQIKIEKELNDLYTYIDNNNSNPVIDAQISINSFSPQYKNKVLANRIKRKRVSKGQRCSLLKKLLTTFNNNINEPPQNNKSVKQSGGLKNLLGFIKHYDFGYKINHEVQECTPLDKLETFSKTFFYTDFTEYRNTILSVINEGINDGSDEEMFEPYDEEEDKRLWKNEVRIKEEKIDQNFGVEEVTVEPDVNIKTEMEYESEYLPSELVQACYEDEKSSHSKEYVDFESYLRHKNGVLNAPIQSSPIPNKPSSLELLQQLAMRTKSSKTLSPHSVKCRTRGRPFIDPELMEQFKRRSFKCDTCNRSFKSPGYLHSHCTKMGH